MDRRIRLVGLGLIVVVSLLATLLLTPPEGSKSVDEVLASPDEYKGESISVRGIVKNGSYNLTEGAFILSGDNSELSVTIGSTQLSTAFSEGKTILVTGILVETNGEWELRSEEIEVGCPSKYEAEGESDSQST